MITRAPILNVLTHEGQSVPLVSLYADAPVALVFLRHLACVFCWEQVEDLRANQDARIVFVSMGTPEQATAFRKEHNASQTFLCDPDEDLYREFGLGNASISQLINMSVARGTVRAMRKGAPFRSPSSNPKRLGGTFVFRTDGTVAWARVARNASDNASIQEVLSALEQAEFRA